MIEEDNCVLYKYSTKEKYYGNASQFYKISADKYNQNGAELLAAKNFVKAAQMEGERFHYGDAACLFLQAAQCYEKLGIQGNAAKLYRANHGYASCHYQNLANSYNQNGDKLSAADNYIKAAQIEDILANFGNAHQLYAKAAICYQNSDNLVKAAEKYNIAIGIANKINDLCAELEYNIANANLYRKLGKCDVAVNYCFDAAKIAVLLNDVKRLSDCCALAANNAKDVTRKYIYYKVALYFYSELPECKNTEIHYSNRVVSLEKIYSGADIDNAKLQFEELSEELSEELTCEQKKLLVLEQLKYVTKGRNLPSKSQRRKKRCGMKHR